MSGKRKSSRRNPGKAGYSVLEGRRLLAVSASLSGGTLSIYGDSGANQIVIGQSGDSLIVAGDLDRQYDISDVSAIEFFGAAGNDSFENTLDIDTLAVGHDGHDTLITSGGTDRLFGGEGNDTLVSTGGNDRLVGNNGDDTLAGGAGDDALYGLNGNDELDGEAGDDVLVAGVGDDTVYGGAGDDLAYGHLGNDRIYGGADNDRLFGQDDDDFIQGDSGDDVVRGNAGVDRLNGNFGNDRILGDDGADTINGGDGNEVIFAGAGDDIVRGGNDNDLIFAGSGNDVVYGEAGNDVIRGNDGNDTIEGGDNADRIAGDNGNDVLDGGRASDTVLGDAGADTINGDSSDRVTGGAGDDVLQLGSGGGDLANYSGNYSRYSVTHHEGSLLIYDETGVDGQDLVSGADSLVFADGSRAAEAQVTQRVYVQPIVVSNDNGSNRATFFGNEANELEMKRFIDQIYLQAGIDVEWLDTRETNNTFFNYGNGTGVRPQQDLPAIISQGDNAGVGNSDAKVLDVYFINRVPGFQELSANTANGLAYVSGNGVGMHVGENLLDFTSGRSVVARVVAHEIAHNLGLDHVNDSSNLMDDGDQLYQSQINTIRDSVFSQVI